MRERPILFSGAMVRAILEGRKTQTRRVCKARGVDFIGSGGRSGADWNDPDCWGYEAGDGEWYVLSRSPSNGMRSIVCPYGQPSDRLWVRETWAAQLDGDGDMQEPITYRATYNEAVHGPLKASFKPRATEIWDSVGNTGWKPSMHMPRAYSRITLEIIGVRCERVNEISEADAQAEGADQEFRTVVYSPDGVKDYHIPTSHRGGFANLWDGINAKRGYSWDSNPWVWVVEFKRI